MRDFTRDHSSILCAVLLAATLFVAPFGVARAEEEPAPKFMKIGVLIAKIKTELQRAQNLATSDPRLILEQVDVKLSIVQKNEVGAGVEFGVPLIEDLEVGFGGALKNRAVQTLKISLKPLSTFPITGAEEVDLGIVDAIKSIKSALRVAEEPDPPLGLGRIELTLDFVLVRQADGKIKFLFFKAGGETSRTISQSMVIRLRQLE